LAQRIGLLDHPSDRKVHQTSTPLVGGTAIFIALVVAVSLATPYTSEALHLLAACGLMLITGMLDDLHELSPRTRFITQILACCIMVFASGVVLTDFGSLVWNGVLQLGWFSIPLTIFSALGVINAFNMMDGIDGLSSIIFIIAGTAMAWLAAQAGHGFNAAMLTLAVAAVVGFFLLNARLPWNKKARVFLGDSGSAFLGLFLAWQFIALGNGDDRAFAPMTAVWLLGVPLVDTIRLMAHRWRRGGSSMEADQYHLHHAFLKAGFSVNQTLIGIAVLVLFTTAVGLTGHLLGWPEYLMFYAYMAFGIVYLYIMRRCWVHGRFLGRDVAAELT
jgi:UDP-GlcNAc:undecaprenyl-phosphate GlcNAc-1-phosphate transferase